MTLPDSFEDDLRAAVLDDVEQQFRDEIGSELIDIARDNWEAYAGRNDYDIGHIPTEARLSVERDDSTVSARIEWPELTALFEWGVDPHTIEGNPLLHFYWEAKDQWITTESVNWGSETGGIPESRAIRDAVEQLAGGL
ncbi:hypothetical protein [Haloarcula sebkhae]|uniref:Uncharacterized protein n=2 Tax=Haloarcula sebkhae TaxID=932660 RepID=A0ACC6VIS8_9EURY|nr:hypothetical protein [Haloarcula sebkhae]GGK74543.1 hypothetical protein GCM10009067_28430 [Haloarcula sebkhae]